MGSSDYRTSTELGRQTLGGHNKTLHTRTQEKGAVTPKETEPDLPVSIPEAPVKVSVESDQLQGQGR